MVYIVEDVMDYTGFTTPVAKDKPVVFTVRAGLTVVANCGGQNRDAVGDKMAIAEVYASLNMLTILLVSCIGIWIEWI